MLSSPMNLDSTSARDRILPSVEYTDCKENRIETSIRLHTVRKRGHRS